MAQHAATAAAITATVASFGPLNCFYEKCMRLGNCDPAPAELSARTLYASFVLKNRRIDGQLKMWLIKLSIVWLGAPGGWADSLGPY